MKLAGKCPPEKEELSRIEEMPFENIELYIEKKHLDNFDETVENLENSSLNVVSVHTPHVGVDELDYFSLADDLASRFDAFLVCHSKQIILLETRKVEEHGLKSPHGYENQPGASYRHLKAALLDREVNMVLDTAHLYTAEEDYVQIIEDSLMDHLGQIPLIHLCDSTLTDDGLPFGDGEMNMEKVCRTFAESDFDGILVFEVMPDYQEEALDKLNEWLQ